MKQSSVIGSDEGLELKSKVTNIESITHKCFNDVNQTLNYRYIKNHAMVIYREISKMNQVNY